MGCDPESSEALQFLKSLSSTNRFTRHWSQPGSSWQSEGELINSMTGLVICGYLKTAFFPWFPCVAVSPFQTSEDGKQEKMENDKQEKSGDNKQEKKNDQPPQAKKPKVKTKTVELPVQNNLHWQLPTDVLNMFVENEVML